EPVAGRAALARGAARVLGARERPAGRRGDPVRQSDFVHWASGRPSMSSSEEARDACGALAVESLLYDVPCDDPLPFFCLRVQSPSW
ncbi:Protein of unknown function, partial [Gryllus bimaculatus]